MTKPTPRRPRTGALTANVSLKVTPEAREEWHAAARERGSNLSALMTEAMTRLLATESDGSEALSRAS